MSNLRNEGTLGKDQLLSSEGVADLKKLTMDKVGHIEITVNEFTAIFKGDDYGRKMINILNEEVLKQDLIAEQERKQHELQMQN